MKNSNEIVWVSKDGHEFSISNHPVLIQKYTDLGYTISRSIQK